mmetsp:Transcript_80122/g.166679  ORF Transcript_80122/g.166679 Transcript_80122/m.166679 type:complete len:796 (+) Transcript_80122:2654-5041(+)
MAVKLRVTIDAGLAAEAAAAVQAPEATVRVCGGSPELGNFDPKGSPILKKVEGQDIWEGTLTGGAAKPGQEFKFVVLNLDKHQYVWENGSMHIMPKPDEPVVTRTFNDAKATKPSGTAAPAKKPATQGGYTPGPAPPAATSKEAVKKQLEVVVPSTVLGQGRARVVVCGGAPELGNWNPKQAPALVEAGAAGTGKKFAGDVKTVPGTEYKYVVINVEKGNAKWEQNRPNRHFGKDDTKQHFDQLGEGEQQQQQQQHHHHHHHHGGGGRGFHVEAKDKVTLDAASQQFEDAWIPWSCEKVAGIQGSGSQSPSPAPRTIFHAFHWQFADVEKKLEEFKAQGFDAVQISPAQKSKSGGQWWARYQPKDYTKIEGLGSTEDLQKLCKKAQELGLMIIGDVVFNHMIVVASGHEWGNAQGKPDELARLKQKLSQAVGPSLCADDFQWPWFNMSGPHWDNDNRYEGWGNGEWSELRHCKKVVDVHCQHLKTLLDAGVRGIRFDAVKHMRPAHVKEYVDFVRSNSQPGEVYLYGEVLSVQEKMHLEYMDSNEIATTDFALTVFFNRIFKEEGGGKEAVLRGVKSAAMAAAAKEGLDLKATDLAETETAEAPSAPMLSADSVRFARNHDTVMNPGTFYGLGSNCLKARVLWALLLAVHDGTVLVFPEDFQDKSSGDLIRQAVNFRAKLASKAASSEVCLRSISSTKKADESSEQKPKPMLLTVTVSNKEGHVEGVCLLNVTKTSEITVHDVPVRKALPGKTALTSMDNSLECVLTETGSVVAADGKPQDLKVAPWDALFLISR